MALARVAPLDRDAMVARIRIEVEDPSALATGQAIPESQRDFSDATVIAALEDAFIQLQHEILLVEPSESIQPGTTTHVAGTGAALPSGFLSSVDLIYKVENYDDPDNPIGMDYVSALEIDRFSGAGPSRWTYISSTPSGASGHPTGVIQVRPDADMALRVWALRGPIIPGAGTDAHGYTARWRELIQLKAARILRSRHDEFRIQQQQRLDELKRNFNSLAKAVQGPQRIRLTRPRF